MNKSLIMLVSVLAFGFLIVFILNSSTIMATYYRYTSYPSFNCTYSLEGLTWNEKCISNHTRGFWYCNGENWEWKTQTAPFGFQCVGGHFKELPKEPAVKVASFSVDKYKANIGDTVYETILVYNMGTATANDKICSFDINNSQFEDISKGNDVTCYQLYLEGGGSSKVFKLPVKITSADKNIVGYIIFENGKPYISNNINIQVKPKAEAKVSWKVDKYSALPGRQVTFTYNVYVTNGPLNFSAHACIIPQRWLNSNIKNDFLYVEPFCNTINRELNSGNNIVRITVNSPKYGYFDHKYGLGSEWYGYGNYYVIGTTYKYNDKTYSSWNYKFEVVNSTNKVSTQPIGEVQQYQNKYYEGIFAIIVFGIAIYLYKKYIK